MENSFGHFGLSVNPSSNALFNYGKVHSGDEYCVDTALRLDSPGTSSLYNSLKGTKRKWNDISRTEVFGHASLALGLGRSPSSSDSSKMSSATACTMSSAKETDEESSIDLGLNFQLHLGNDNIPSPKKPHVAISKALQAKSMFNLQLSLSTGPLDSTVTDVIPVAAWHHQSNLYSPAISSSRPVANDESTSSHWKLGIPLPPYQHTSEMRNKFPAVIKAPAIGDSVTAMPDLSSTITPVMRSPVTCTSGVSHPQQRNANTKSCQFPGCVKGARGASGLCIAHGGGRRCQKEGCHKGAEGRTIYCKAHGGGRRCEHLGCTKSAEGRTDFCIAHGGGRRCSHEGCARAARGKSGRCIRHGGGKRCQKENCTKSAEGYSGLCISHGGGRRCQYPECKKGAQGSTMFCKAHGGGKRCTYPGCTKGAEGSTPFCKGHGGGKRCSFQGGGVCPKSVHGGTLFCVAHGGGKRCAVPECGKSARGRTDFCVRHGGGKRCKFEGCGKSAQGSTDFCKAHGGGKRCAWGQPGSEFGANDPACDRFARGKTGLCAAHGALVQDNCVHGGAVLGSVTVKNTATNKPEKMKEVAVEENMFIKTGNGGQGLLFWNGFEQKKVVQPVIPPHSNMTPLTEGRVHGGSLMAMLASGSGTTRYSGSRIEGSTSGEQAVAYPMAHSWF